MSVQDLVRHLRSTKGAGVAVAAVLGVLSALIGGPVGRALAAVAVVVAAAVLLALSALLSELRGRSTTPSAPVRRPAPAVGRGTASDESFAAARAALAAVPLPPAATSGAMPRPAPPPAHDGPAVTVVIPCFDEERFVGDAIRSVIAQRFTDWECIVVDDASTDGSTRTVLDLAAGDARVHVVRHRVNGGLSAARNTGLRLARGRWVTFLDADDMLTSESLADRVAALADVPADVVGSYTGIRLVPEDVTLEGLEPTYGWPDRRVVDFASSGGECPFPCHAPLTRTDLLRALGGFDEAMRDGAEDWDAWSRVLRAGYAWVPATGTTAVYRQKRGSMVRAKLERHVAISTELLGRAYAELDTSTLGAVCPLAFDRPVTVYEQQLKSARRVLRSAAVALIGGDAQTAAALVAELREVPRELVERHTPMAEVARAGVRRAFGFGAADVTALGERLERLELALGRLVEEQLPTSAGVTEVRPGPTVDVIAVAATAAHARAMLAVAGRTPRLRWVFVDVARVAGEQGAAAVLETAGVETWSLNELALRRAEARLVVVASPRLRAVEDVVAEAGGARVVELAVDGRDVLRVDGAEDRAELETLTGDELAEVVAALGPDAPTGGAWRLADPTASVCWATEEYPRTAYDAQRLERFRDRHKGERCVLIGNGPSLNELDVSLLADEATFGVNGIFYKTDEVGIDLLYYVVEDTAVMADNLERIREYRARGHRFFPSIYREKVGERDDTTFFMMNRGFYAPGSPDFCVPRFSTDVRQRVFTGQSVTIINLQLAYWMGFTEVVLIGMDFSYTVPDDAVVEGNLITSQSDDPNHFHPEYFGKGKVWKDPKLDRVLANYQLAKSMFEADGRRIVNATAGGKLELFDRVEYDRLFG